MALSEQSIATLKEELMRECEACAAPARRDRA